MLAQHRARERGGIGVGERRRHAAHRERRRDRAPRSEAEVASVSRVLLGGRDFERLGRERRRHQQRLHRHARVERRLQPLVHDALVRRVHVDDHQAVAVLREDVDAVQLREREAERMRIVVGRTTVGAARRIGARAEELAHRTPTARDSMPSDDAAHCDVARTTTGTGGGVLRGGDAELLRRRHRRLLGGGRRERALDARGARTGGPRPSRGSAPRSSADAR